MSLFLNKGNVSACPMQRLLSALLVLLLLSSHGAMSLAAPHADGAEHGWSHEHAHDAESDASNGHFPAAEQPGTTASDLGDTDENTDTSSAAHVHAVSDQAPQPYVLPGPFPASAQLIASPVAGLESRSPLLLLEPPSA